MPPRAQKQPLLKKPTAKPRQKTTASIPRQPVSKTPAKPPANPGKSSSASSTKPESRVDATPPMKNKRARANESAPALKPTKRLKTGSNINTTPSQRLDIYVVGAGGYGELGLGYKRRNGKKPNAVQRPRLNDLLDASTVGVVQFAVGGMHCVALTHDNKILTWGVNDNGALGRATARDPDEEDDEEDDEDFDLNPKESVPTAIPSSSFTDGTKFSQVVASDSASFALTVTGHVYGWGTFTGGDGIIGFSREETKKADAIKKKDVQRTPILIPELKKIKLLAAGGNHIQALDTNGNVFTWGCGEQNQLGRRIVERTRANALVPAQFGLPKGKITDISCGAFHSFAVDDQGRVWAWGLNNFGQTGISNGAGEANAVIEKPRIVQSLGSYEIREIQGGNHHSIACTKDHKLLVWGRCDDSQPGIPIDRLPESALIVNAQNTPRILSVPSVVPGISATCVSAGIDNSLAITNQGHVYSWGFSESYRTGLGTQDTVEEPTRIDNTALINKSLTFAGCGAQFSVFAGPATARS